MTHTDVANALSWQQGKVSKIESARQRAGVDTVIAIAQVCQASTDQRERLVELAHTARGNEWWESYSAVLGTTEKLYVGLEAEAHTIRVFGTETIPSLLRTRDYAAAVLEAEQRFLAGMSGSERRLAVLVERQREVLERKPVRLDVILAESAVRRVVGDSRLLCEQLRYLAELARLPHVSLRLLPFSAGALPADGAFSVLEYSAGYHPDVVFTSGWLSGAHSEMTGEVERYRDALRSLASLALSPEDSIQFIEQVEQQVS